MGNRYGQSGWLLPLIYFLRRGYKQSELYAFTWGDANALNAANNYHSKENLTRVRKFIEAVLDYTGASQVDIVSHSMGVTLARKAVKGGPANDPLDGGDYDLGPLLTSNVDDFVGIAGANQGLVSCFLTNGSTLTCNSTNGFYPGVLALNGQINNVSRFLSELNNSRNFEGTNVYSIWSTYDQLVGYAGIVYSKNTMQIPGQDGQRKLSFPFDHFLSKDLTAKYIYNFVR